MDVAKKITLPDWLATKEAKALMGVLNQGGRNTLFVGGCVRNALMEGAGATDIDIATKLKPNDIVQVVEKAGFKSVPTGIEHGTVTVVVEGKPFEVTTLRQDVATDGRHAEVDFTEDWVADAKRRDFTVNTLLCDLKGNVYDPLKSGIDDINTKRIVFVGNPANRIVEDYLRILRFFRFHAQYGEGELDQCALAACCDAADKIYELSRERITQELLKILRTGSAADVLKIMLNNNILNKVFDKNYKHEMLVKLCDLQKGHDAVNVMARLFVISGNRARFHDDILRLTHVQKKFLVKMDMAVHAAFYENEKELKKAIFYHGNDLLLQGFLFNIALGKVDEDRELINMVTTWQAPQCPVNGQTLLAEGYETGPELGQELARRQEEWLELVLS